MSAETQKKETRKPHRAFGWYVLLGLGFLILTNVGYLNLALHAKPGFRYTGANSYTAADKLVYLSMVEQGREGLLFMKNLHTTDPQQGLMLSPHWYLIGQTGRLFGISNNAAYQIYRVLATAAFVYVLYYFIRLLFEKESHRLTAAAFVFASGGLGWLFMIIHPSVLSLGSTSQKFLWVPVDFYVTEGNTLLNFSQSPLFAASQLLLLAIFFVFVRNDSLRKLSVDIGNAALVAVLILMHPYDLPIIAMVLGSWTVWQLWQKRSISVLYRFGIVMTGAALAFAYHLYSVAADPVLSEWLKQNLVYSPPLRNYVWGYGLLLPLWFIGSLAILRQRKNDPWWMLVILWAGTTWLLLYAPTTLNRRFTNGFHIPLALVASYGVLWLHQQSRRLWLKAGISLTVWGAFAGFIVLFLLINLHFSQSVYSYGYYYITADEQRTIDFLRKNSTAEDALLLSDEMLAFTITSQLNRTVFRGHNHQTPQAILRQQQLDWFLGDQRTRTSLARKKEFLKAEGIDFVIFDARRLKVPAAWTADAPFLTEVFQSGPLTVYRVSLAEDGSLPPHQ